MKQNHAKDMAPPQCKSWKSVSIQLFGTHLKAVRRIVLSLAQEHEHEGSPIAPTIANVIRFVAPLSRVVVS